MKWSLTIGRFFGTEIRLHASLLLLVPYTLVVFHPTDLSGALRVLLLIAAIFACVALHEMGHTLAAQAFGIQVTSIVLWPLGGFANLSRRPEKLLPDLFVSAAGPLANLLVALFLGAIAAALRIFEISPVFQAAFPAADRLLSAIDAFAFLFSLTIANLSLAVFNLVPIFPLDGGQIARGVLKALFGEKRADLIMLTFSLPISLALVIAGLFARDVIFILTGLLLVLAAATLNPRLFNAMTLGFLYFIDRGGYYLKRSDFDPAVREYTRTIQRRPNRAGLYVSRAMAYMNLMELANARADTDRALQLDPNHYIAWGLRGELLSLEKQDQAAMDCYNRALAIRPNWAIGYLDRGGRYQDRGDFDQALQEMNKAVELGHGSPICYLMRGMLHHRMGNVEAAQKDADQALRYAPQWMLVFTEVFLTSLDGQLNWALAYYWRAILQLPNAYQCYLGRGDACRINQRPAWAVADYDRAALLAPRQAEIYLNRGRAYLQLNEPQKAAADFRQAVQFADRAHIRRQAQNLLNQTAWTAPTTAGPAASPAPGAPAEPPAGSAELPPSAG